jgi:hypothetical protein
VFGNKSPVSSPSKTIRSPDPSSQPPKNNNYLVLIVTIPCRRWIACREEAWCGGLSICHLSLQRQWRCRRWRHREGVHEVGRGRRQYDVVEMAEQRGVSTFAREGRVCAPLLDLALLGWTAAASGTGAQRSAVRRHRRRLRHGKRMVSNFSVLQRKL